MIIASVSLKPLAAASISAGKLRARPSSHRRFAAQRPAGSFSAEHEARLSSHNPTGGSSSIDEASVVDPYGHVADVMSSPARTLTTGLPLEDAIVATTMERYRGVPVVDPETGTCVGVLSMKDLEKVGNLSGYTVEDVMSTPPRTCLQRATVASVAGMMLKHKCHRIPVVNDRDVPIGIVTRSDIFEPLLATSQDLLVNQETRRRHRRPHTPIVDAVSRADPHAWSRRVNTRLGSGVSFEEDEETHERLRRGMASDEGRWTTWRWTRDDDDDDDDDEEY